MKRMLILLVGLFLLLSALPALAQPDVTVFTTAQRFERGLMLWRSDTAMIYVLADSGRAYSFPAAGYSRLPDNPIFGNPPSRLRPINGFGRVWGSRPDLRAALGWPVQPEMGFDMRIVNAYGAIYLRQLNGTIYQVNRGGTWNLAPGFPSQVPTPTPSPYPEGAVIQYFNVQPMTVNPGGSINVAWSIVGAPQGIIEVYALATGEIVSNYFGVPANGTVDVPLAPDAKSDLKIVLTAAYPQPQYGYVRSASTEVVVRLSTTTDHSVITYGAFQQYQQGFMIWRSDSGDIDVFFTADQRHSLYPISAYVSLPDNPYNGSTPPGLARPVNGFGRVWGNFDAVREALGWATGGEQGYQMTIGLSSSWPTFLSLPDGRTARILGGGTRWTVS